jgi:hypothetical protein
VHHRRWMIRAFAIAIGVGTLRIWIGVFQASGLLDFPSSFGPAFSIAFSLHVVAAELWLRAFPNPPEIARASGLQAEPAAVPETVLDEAKR